MASPPKIWLIAAGRRTQVIPDTQVFLTGIPSLFSAGALALDIVSTLLLTDTFSFGAMTTGRAPDVGAGTWSVTGSNHSDFGISAGALFNSTARVSSQNGGFSTATYSVSGGPSSWKIEVLTLSLATSPVLGIDGGGLRSLIDIVTTGTSGTVSTLKLKYVTASNLDYQSDFNQTSSTSRIVGIPVATGTPLRLTIESAPGYGTIATIERFTGTWVTAVTSYQPIAEPLLNISITLPDGNAASTQAEGDVNPVKIDSVIIDAFAPGFGAPGFINLNAITSAFAAGALSLTTTPHAVTLNGISSGEAFGLLTVPGVSGPSVLLYHFDGSGTSNAGIVAHTFGLLFTTPTKFGSGAISDNADLFTLGDNAAPAIDADFSMDFWVYITTGSNPSSVQFGDFYDLAMFSDAGDTFGDYSSIGITGPTILFDIFDATPIAVVGPAGTPNLDTYNHIEISRIGSTWRLFLNGVLLGSGTDSTVNKEGDNIFLGLPPGVFVDEFRAQFGTGGHTANFTPPTAPY